MAKRKEILSDFDQALIKALVPYLAKDILRVYKQQVYKEACEEITSDFHKC